MPDIGHIFDVVLRTLREPAVHRTAAWATLAGVLLDVAVALLARGRSASLLDALSTRLRGWTGAIAAGIVHLALIGGAATVLTLAATRLNVVLGSWWASGAALGVGFAFLVLLLQPDARRPPTRLAGPVLLGLAIALAARLLR